MRYFYRVDGQNNPVPGSLAKFKSTPILGKWREVPKDACCDDLCEPAVCPCETTFTYTISANAACGDIRITIDIDGVQTILIAQGTSSGGAQTLDGQFKVFEGDIITVTVENIDPCTLSGTIDIDGSIEGDIQSFNGSVSSAASNLADPVPFTVVCDSTYTMAINVSSDPS